MSVREFSLFWKLWIIYHLFKDGKDSLNDKGEDLGQFRKIHLEA